MIIKQIIIENFRGISETKTIHLEMLNTIVGFNQKENIIHISKEGTSFNVSQSNIDYKQIALDLGIKPDNTFTPLFSTSKLVFLVEGIDNANAMHHKANLYKQEGQIQSTFEELGVNIIPIGGCGGVLHWVNLDLFTKLEKPFFIFLDSDKATSVQQSPNELKLINYGLTCGVDFLVSKKRLLENYILPSAIQRLVPAATLINYGDFNHAKNICKDYPSSVVRGQIGGKKVAEKHYCSLTFDEIRMTWFDGTEDEFLNIYNLILSKLN